MSAATASKPGKSRTKITFDLYDVLTPQEVKTFEQRASEAGAPNLTEHFLNVTIRLPHQVQPQPKSAR